MRSRTFLLALAIAALSLPACGENDGNVIDNGGGGGGEENGTNNGPSEAERRLAVVGPALIQLESGGEATIRVALAEEEVGPVADEVVEFNIAGESGGSLIDDGVVATALTDSQGLASVNVKAGSEQTTFQVTATSPGANMIAVSVQVVRLQHRISIVRTPSVRVATSGTQANVDSTAFSRVLLRVRITDQFGRPVPDVQVTYSMSEPAQSASLEGAGSPVVTNPGGEAQMALDTGEDLDDTFEVTARTAESAPASWNVRLQTDESRICESDDDCGPGLYCRNGICQGSAACSNEEPVIECPAGYRCVVNECHPWVVTDCEGEDDCPPGFVCVDGECEPETQECEEDEDCPAGEHCQDGVCVVDPDGDIPNIAGGWYTAHHFDIREGLPDVIDTAAGPLREIHRILLGEISWPGWVPTFVRDMVEDLIEDLIDEYVPPEVTTVVQILDTLVTVMSDLRSRGYMAVTQRGEEWDATEIWDSFVFYYLPMCSGAPPSDPTPECARVDLFVDDMTDEVSLGLNVKPFEGLVGEIEDDGTALMLVDEREIEMNIARLIRWVVDELVSILTPHDDLESAVLASVDCNALAQTVDDWVGDWYDVTDIVETACNAGVAILLDRVLDALTGIAFDVGMLEIEGQATVNELGAGNYATRIGYPDYEDSRDGSWDGSFTRVVGGVPGAWHGSRSSIP